MNLFVYVFPYKLSHIYLCACCWVSAYSSWISFLLPYLGDLNWRKWKLRKGKLLLLTESPVFQFHSSNHKFYINRRTYKRWVDGENWICVKNYIEPKSICVTHLHFTTNRQTSDRNEILVSLVLKYVQALCTPCSKNLTSMMFLLWLVFCFSVISVLKLTTN